MAKENVSNTAKLKEKKRAKENELAGVKSSWTPLKQELNEKVKFLCTLCRRTPKWLCYWCQSY